MSSIAPTSAVSRGGPLAGSSRAAAVRMAQPQTAPPEVEAAADPRDELAPLWRVICHDDPLTTMDFVVEVLMEVFRVPALRAFELMLLVHHTGAAVVGRWPESTAKRRAERARAKARAEGFPLTFTVERDD
ncbi:MAG: ATP-dependent Clp protease adaptor ClpS [Planctomycetota bacterium]